MTKKLLLPEEVRAHLLRRYSSQQKAWLLGEGTWPISIPLGVPMERDAVIDPTGVRSWVEAWSAWPSAGAVLWVSRQWGRLGTQQLPASLALTTPREVARALGDAERWGMLEERYRSLVGRWPRLRGHAVVTRNFGVLGDYSDEDFLRFTSMLAWLEAHPASGLFPRQLPVEGLDTKWLGKRTGCIADFVRQLRGADLPGDFYDVCGLLRPPHRIRIRVLCPELRRTVGGLKDIEAPLVELGALTIAPRILLIVENLETGLALPDIPGVVAFMKLGNAVSTLAEVPWAHGCRGIYWGDLDTHGLAILNRARGVFPGLESLLMDENTLTAHRALCVEEPVQCTESDLPYLTDSERSVFEGLRAGRWGSQLRLEQERIPWQYAVQRIESATQT